MESPTDLVRRFCAAWSDNVSTVELIAFFADDAVYLVDVAEARSVGCDVVDERLDLEALELLRLVSRPVPRSVRRSPGGRAQRRRAPRRLPAGPQSREQCQRWPSLRLQDLVLALFSP